jgi:hypothetical protein
MLFSKASTTKKQLRLQKVERKAFLKSFSVFASVIATQIKEINFISATLAQSIIAKDSIPLSRLF